MRKKLLTLVMATAFVGMLAGCKADDKGTASEDLAKAGTTQNEVSNEKRESLKVGFDAEFPPYGYMDDNGEYVGFDLDLAAEVCNRNGWELVKQPIDWDSKDLELNSGSIDCIWNGFTINGREDLYTWSEPYVDNSQVFVVSGDSQIQKSSDLAGKIVAVQKDSSALAALNDEEVAENIALRDSFAQLIEYADYNTAFMDLEQGAVECVVIDIGVASYQIGQRKEGSLRMLDEDLAKEQYGIGFKLGNTALRDQVQKTLDEMVADGTFEKITTKWDMNDKVCLGK